MRKALKPTVLLIIFFSISIFNYTLVYGTEVDSDKSVYASFNDKIRYGYVRRILSCDGITEENKRKLLETLEEENRLYENIIQIREYRQQQRIKDKDTLNKLCESIMEDVYSGKISKYEADERIKEKRKIELYQNAAEVKRQNLLLSKNKEEICILNRNKSCLYKLIKKSKDTNSKNQNIIKLIEVLNKKNECLRKKIEILQ